MEGSSIMCCRIISWPTLIAALVALNLSAIAAIATAI
jgi:hypothetical protein